MVDSLTRIITKCAAAIPQDDPGAAAMQSAAELGKGPAGMPLLKLPNEKKEEAGGDDAGKDAIRMAHELDSKSKEINGLRQQLQEAKFDTMRTQLKADIAQEQTKMRESLKEEQQRMHEKLRAEQKELDKRQSQLQLAEAQHKANNIAAEAEHKSKISIAEAQHKAKLDSDVSAHDAEIAQHKADSLMDIAQRTTDMYVKQTDKARADADKYWQNRDKQYKDSHPIISPALQRRLDGAMTSVGRVGKSLAAALQTKAAAAATTDKTNQQPGGSQPTTHPAKNNTMAAYDPNKSGMATKPPSFHYTNPNPNENTDLNLPESKFYDPSKDPEAANQGQYNSHFDNFMPQDTTSVPDFAKALASQENELTQMRANKADPRAVAEFEKRHNEAKMQYEQLKKTTQEKAKSGDVQAKEQMAQLDDLSNDSGAWWWHEESDLDKIRNQYKNQQTEAGHGWLYKGLRAVGNFIDIPGAIGRAIADNNRVRRMYAVRGTERGWFGDGDGSDAANAAAAAAQSRGLKTSVMGHALNIATPILEAAGTIATFGTAGAAFGAGRAALQAARAINAASKLGRGAKILNTAMNVGKAVVPHLLGAGPKAGASFLGQAAGYGKMALNGVNTYMMADLAKNHIVNGLGNAAGRRMQAYGVYGQGNDALMYTNAQGNTNIGNGMMYGANGELTNSWTSPGQIPQYIPKAAGARRFLEKWAGYSSGVLGLNSDNARSFQNDPYWLKKTQDGAYRYGLLNMAAPWIEQFTGISIHPTRPILGTERERWDSAKFEKNFQEAYERLIPKSRDYMTDMGQAIEERWQRYNGVDPSRATIR